MAFPAVFTSYCLSPSRPIPLKASVASLFSLYTGRLINSGLPISFCSCPAFSGSLYRPHFFSTFPPLIVSRHISTFVAKVQLDLF